MHQASRAKGSSTEDGRPSNRTITAATTTLVALILLGTAMPALLFPVGVALLAAALWILPALACPAIVLTLPFYLHPRVVAGQELSVTELAIGIAVATTTARLLVQRWRSNHPAGVARDATVLPPRTHRVDWLVAALLLSALLSLLVTEYPRQSARELRWLVIEPVLVLYLARATLPSPTDLRLTLGAIVAAGVVASVAAWLSLAANGQLLSAGARVADPYLSPNHLGLFLGRAASVALAWTLFGRRRVAPVGALVLMGLTVLRTLSMGAWLGLGASAAVLSALRSRRLLFVMLGAFALIAIASLTVLPSERTWGRLDPSRGTALFRLQVWDSSIHMIADHPLLGVGLDNFLYQYRSIYIREDAWEEPNISHPHNWVLHFWLQLGILGLASFVALAAWMLHRSWRMLRSQSGPTERLVGAAVLGMTIDLLVHGLVDNSYFLVDAAVLFWLGAAMLVILDQSPRNPLRSQ